MTPSQCSFFKMLRYGTGEKAAQNEKWKNVLWSCFEAFLQIISLIMNLLFLQSSYFLYTILLHSVFLKLSHFKKKELHKIEDLGENCNEIGLIWWDGKRTIYKSQIHHCNSNWSPNHTLIGWVIFDSMTFAEIRIFWGEKFR